MSTGISAEWMVSGLPSGQLNFEPGRVQPQAFEITLMLQKFQGAFGTIPAIAHHEVAGLPGMPPDLVLSSG